MVLEEFVHVKTREMEKALEKLNKKKIQNGDGENYIMEGDCKCPYGDVDPSDCEDLCRLNHK